MPTNTEVAMTTPNGPGAPEVPRYESTRGDAENTGKVHQTASTASDEASHVAEVAKDQAREVTSEVRTQARDLVGELKTQVRDQSVSQRDRLSETLRTFGDDLDEMNRSTPSPGLASDLASQAANKARELSAFLDEHEPGDLIDEIRAFARRRPGTFLLAAAIAGVVAGRVTRGAVASNNGTDASAGRSGRYRASQPTLATAADEPPAGRAAETSWNVTNGPAEPSTPDQVDPAVSAVGGSGILPDDRSFPEQGRL
jgi:hypothetical protein